MKQTRNEKYILARWDPPPFVSKLSLVKWSFILQGAQATCQGLGGAVGCCGASSENTWMLTLKHHAYSVQHGSTYVTWITSFSPYNSPVTDSALILIWPMWVDWGTMKLRVLSYGFKELMKSRARIQYRGMHLPDQFSWTCIYSAALILLRT